jgi:hypothetical protein
MSSSQAEIRRVVDKQIEKIEDFCSAIKIELFSGISDLTRVKSGRLRGNWQIQEGKRARGELDRLDPNGEIVKAEIYNEATGFGLTFFTNNLPYAKVYEEKDGMVAKNVVRIKARASILAGEVL